MALALFHLVAVGAPILPGAADLAPFAAEMCLIGTIVAVLLTPFFAGRSPNTACAMVSLAGLVLALCAVLTVGMGPEVFGSHFRGLLVADNFSMLWKVLLLVFAIGIVLLWLTATGPTMHEGDAPEFFTLLLGATLGMAVMAATSNLLMLFMAVEMASLPSYVMAGFRKTHRLGAEASLKYVLFGAATSAIMVYGLSMLYGVYGTLQIDTLVNEAGQRTPGLAELMVHQPAGSTVLLAVAVFGIIVGLGFKISAVPFHFWCPDVFEGASIDVSAFLSVASKGAGLVLLLRVLMVISDALGYQNHANLSLNGIAAVIGILGAVTATVGNTGAFVQNNIKRLLAYSSIAHAGYMLCALSLLVNHNAVQTGAGLNGPAQALLLYLAVYLFMNLGAFTVAAMVWRQTGSEDIDAFAGLGRRSPLLAACMACFMLSLVGLPPFAGFAAKFNIMYCLGLNGGWWWWLVVAIGVNTVFSLFYYARVLKVMYLRSGDQPAFVGSTLGTAVSVVCAVALVLLLIGFGSLTTLTRDYGRLQAVGNGTGAPGVAEPVTSAAGSLP